MTTAEQMDLVNQRLSRDSEGSSVTALVMAEAGLVQGWMKAKRIVSLVTNNETGIAAVFVLSSKNFPCSNADEINVESVSTIGPDFR